MEVRQELIRNKATKIVVWASARLLVLCYLGRPIGVVWSAQQEQLSDADARCISAPLLVPVRSGPGTEYRQVGSLASGVTVNVTESVDAWYRIAEGSALQGWVPARLFSPFNPTSRPISGGKSEAEMRKTKNFGRKSLKEIKELLAEMGLGLGLKLDGWPPKELRR